MYVLRMHSIYVVLIHLDRQMLRKLVTNWVLYGSCGISHENDQTIRIDFAIGEYMVGTMVFIERL